MTWRPAGRPLNDMAAGRPLAESVTKWFELGSEMAKPQYCVLLDQLFGFATYLLKGAYRIKILAALSSNPAAAAAACSEKEHPQRLGQWRASGTAADMIEFFNAAVQARVHGMAQTHATEERHVTDADGDAKKRFVTTPQFSHRVMRWIHQI